METNELKKKMDRFLSQDNSTILEMALKEPVTDSFKVEKDLQTQIAENLKLKNKLANMEKELHKVSAQLITSQENERKRLAFELHDVLGKSLTAIKLNVENAIFTKKRWGHNKTKQLENVIFMVQETIKETREITQNLWPPVLDDLGIIATISWYSREFENTYPWIFVEQTISIMENEIPDLIKIVIFRILQESMNNCVKYSECKTITIKLENDSKGIKFYVEDDGQGFDLKKIHTQQGFGLLSMKERSRLSNGIFEIKSKKDRGTLIKVTWPLKS